MKFEPTKPASRWDSTRCEKFRSEGLLKSLRCVSIFSNLPEADLCRIASYAIPRSLHKGEYLFHKDDPVAGFFIVRKGLINVHRVAPDGREQVIHIFRACESLAEAAIVGTAGYPADARAVEDSDVLLIPKNDFLQQLRDDTPLALRMLAAMSQHLHALVTTIESLKLKDTETRLLHWLLHRCPQPYSSTPVEVELETSKAVLAGELGARQETLSRIFAKLRDAGHLDIHHRSVLVNNPQTLHALFEAALTGKKE